MKNYIIYFVAVISILLFSGCRKEDNVEKPVAKERQDILLTKAQESYLEKGNEFAYRFFKEIAREENKSFVLSPLSVEYVLAMLCNFGDSIDDVLIQSLGIENGEVKPLNEYYSYIMRALKDADNTVSFNLANAFIYNNKLFDIRKADYYSSAATNYYDALIEGFDFANDNVAERVNSWASKNTNGVIPSLLDHELSPSIVALFLNAVYFKGAWNSEIDFKTADTKKDKFYIGENQTVSVPYMSLTSEIQRKKISTYDSVRLPYGNGSFVLDIFLPDASTNFADFIQGICGDEFSNTGYIPVKTHLKIPKFELKNDFKLNDALEEMGIMRSLGKLGVGSVAQKTNMRVDESGAEAAAVTIALISGSNLNSKPQTYEFYANRPFVYMIRETSTGAILFMGVFNGD